MEYFSQTIVSNSESLLVFCIQCEETCIIQKKKTNLVKLLLKKAKSKASKQVIIYYIVM